MRRSKRPALAFEGQRLLVSHSGCLAPNAQMSLGSPTAHSPRPGRSPWVRVKADGGLRRSLRRALTRGHERIIDSFRRIDLDDDGVASYADFTAALDALGLGSNDADARQIFAEICSRGATSSKSPCFEKVGVHRCGDECTCLVIYLA